MYKFGINVAAEHKTQRVREREREKQCSILINVVRGQSAVCQLFLSLFLSLSLQLNLKEFVDSARGKRLLEAAIIGDYICK